MPGDVAVQDSSAVVARQPIIDQPLGILARATLIHAVGQCMHRVGVIRSEVEGLLSETLTVCNIAVFDMGPAAICQKPPVVGSEVPGVAVTKIDAGLVVISHAGEGKQPKGSEQQRQDQRVAWPGVRVHAYLVQRLGRLAVNGERQHRNMAALTFSAMAGGKLCRRYNHLPRLRRLTANRVQPSARSVGQGKIRVSGDCGL